MDEKKIDQVINTIMERCDPKYTTPSGAFLELLRKEAKRKGIVTMSEMWVFVIVAEKNEGMTG